MFISLQPRGRFVEEREEGRRTDLVLDRKPKRLKGWNSPPLPADVNKVLICTEQRLSR